MGSQRSDKLTRVTTLQPTPALVSDPALVRAIAEEIERTGWFALDLEFMTEGRYVAELSLVQVAWGDIETPEVAAVDPLSVDPEPIIALVGDERVEVIIHSAQADLALIGSSFAMRGRRVFDTQIAAGFVGLGEQVGYAALVEHMAGVRLDKAAQFTEWSRRPLSDEQIRYALDDVRYLPAAWSSLRAQLVETGRLDWVADECDRLAAAWAERTPPEEMYRRIRGWNSLKRRSQGALRSLAAWRERESLRSNRPPSWIMNDRTLLEIARRPPRDERELRGFRGLGDGIAQRFGTEILRAIGEGLDNPPPHEASPTPLPQLGQAWPAVISGIVQTRCREAGIAPRFVATRREIDELIGWWLGGAGTDVEVPLLKGWRRALAGQDVLDWLRGETSVIVDPATEAGLRIQR